MRKTERITDDEIVNHLRRFGGLSTSQLSSQLGLTKRGLAGRLNRLNRSRRVSRQPHKSGFLWSAA